MTSARSKYSHSFIGSSTSVLKNDFILSFKTDENFDIKSWLPFTGKIKLPTEMEVLKLCLFLRDEAGRTNQWVKVEDIYKSVAQVVKKYWDRAGFITKSRLDREVEKIHKEYQKLQKDKNRSTPSCVTAREMFLMSKNDKGEKIEKLFDVGHKDLEKSLEQDRIRGNLGVRNEDLSFLLDQRGDRKSFMAGEDTEYQEKKEKQLKRRMGPAPETVTSSSQSSEASSLPVEEEEEKFEDEEEDSEDEERNRRPKRSKLVDIQLPRKFLASPQVTAALDRTNTTPRQAMHILSAVLKTAKKDGESLDLNEVTLSESTIRRGRQKAREKICQQQYEEFKANMPEYLAVHWDGKMMKTLSEQAEMEAILVSGNPGYNEGKLLGKNIK